MRREAGGDARQPVGGGERRDRDVDALDPRALRERGQAAGQSVLVRLAAVNHLDPPERAIGTVSPRLFESRDAERGILELGEEQLDRGARDDEATLPQRHLDHDGSGHEGGHDQAGATKLSMTFLVPALSKAMCSLLPSTAST